MIYEDQSRLMLSIAADFTCGGIVGGSGADRDLLVQRRFCKENKTFPLNTFP